MTIGIAASGPRAGEAIVRALQAVEAIGHGAIGGFLSLAAISDGEIRRVETQQGGAKAAFPGALPDWLMASRCGVLMSSGPNRPEPLAQFTPADPAWGLLTGHRFPNAPGRSGTPLNVAVLDFLRRGCAPQDAVDRVIAENSDADAGLIAVTPDGRIGLGDSSYLENFPDRGHAVLAEGEGIVAVAHNAIAPYRGLALIAAEVAIGVINAHPATRIPLSLAAGLPIMLGSRNAVRVAPDGRVIGLVVSNPLLLSGEQSFGLGYRAPVLGAEPMRWLAY